MAAPLSPQYPPLNQDPHAITYTTGALYGWLHCQPAAVAEQGCLAIGGWNLVLGWQGSTCLGLCSQKPTHTPDARPHKPLAPAGEG